MDINTLKVIVYSAFAILFFIIIPGYFDHKISCKVKNLASELLAKYNQIPGKKLKLERGGRLFHNSLMKQHLDYREKTKENKFHQDWFEEDKRNTLNKIHFFVFGSWYLILIAGAFATYFLNTAPQAVQAIK